MADDSIPQKRCHQCGEIKPATPEYFRQSKRLKDGFHATCKACIKQAEQRSRRERGITPKAYVNEHGERQCKKCLEWKPATTEYFRVDRGRVSSLCKVCSAKAAKNWYISHPEQAILTRKQYQQCHRDEKAAYLKQWKLDNPEYMKGYRLTHAETIRQQCRDWRQRNPEKIRFSVQRRISRRKGLPGTFTDKEWAIALNYFNHRCAVCGRPTGLWHKLVPDHWIPLTYEGSDNPGGVAHNLVPMCHGVGGCNNSKSNKEAHEWVTAKFGKRKAKDIIGRIEAYLEAVKNGSLGNADTEVT